jgi:hypothetical protein
VRKAQISVESYLVYQSVSQKSILCDVYFITLNDIDNIINIKSHENRETKISFTSGRSPGLSQQRI